MKSLLKIIAHLQYCRGVNTIKRKELHHFQEHICSVGDENSEIIQYRAKNCSKVLPFNTSNASSYSACKNCKKLNMKPKVSKSECDVQKTDDNNTYNEHTTKNDEIMLQQSDHDDLSTILRTIFPECSLKMQTFLMNQKMALERNPNGRRWSKEIVRLCLTLYCRSPRGCSELRNSIFLILPSYNLLRKYKNSVHQEAGIKKDMLEWMANEAKLKNIPPCRI